LISWTAAERPRVRVAVGHTLSWRAPSLFAIGADRPHFVTVRGERTRQVTETPATRVTAEDLPYPIGARGEGPAGRQPRDLRRADHRAPLLRATDLKGA
jgi:hypothetical protein